MWLDLLGIIFLLFAVYLILTTIFGNSATPIEVTVMLFVGLGTLFGTQLYKLNREIGETRVKTKHGFNKMKEDFGIIKTNFNIVKEDFNIIKTDFNIVKEDFKVIKRDFEVVKIDLNIVKEDLGLIRNKLSA